MRFAQVVEATAPVAPDRPGLVRFDLGELSLDARMRVVASIESRFTDWFERYLSELSPEGIAEVAVGSLDQVQDVIGAGGAISFTPIGDEGANLYTNQANSDIIQDSNEQAVLNETNPTNRRSPVGGSNLADVARSLQTDATREAPEALNRSVSALTARLLDTQLESIDRSNDAVDLLGEIAVAAAFAGEIRERLQASATQAHELGVSWSDIARAAGVTPSTAQRRWDPIAKASHAQYQRSRTTSTNQTED